MKTVRMAVAVAVVLGAVLYAACAFAQNAGVYGLSVEDGISGAIDLQFQQPTTRLGLSLRGDNAFDHRSRGATNGIVRDILPARYQSGMRGDHAHGLENGVITQVCNRYDRAGNRVLGTMRITYYDESGHAIREDLMNEVSSYNRDGNLIGQSSYLKVNGKLQWVVTMNRAYIGEGRYLETKSTINYNADGALTSFTIERSAFTNGMEVKYSLARYENGVLTHVIRRQAKDGRAEKFEEMYDAAGNVTFSCRTVDETRFDESGRILYSRHFYTTATRPAWGPFAGQLTTTREEETIIEYEYDGDGTLIKEHEYGYWFTISIDPWFDRLTTFAYDVIGGVKQLVNKHIFRIESEDKVFTKVTYRYTEDVTNYFNKDTGMLESTVSSSEEIRYDGNGNITSTTTKRDNAWYDETGKIIKKYHFYRQAQPWYEHEEETTTDYVYDSDGDLVQEHEYGYWFTTYKDPWFDKFTTFFYDLVNGAKKLVHKTVDRVEAEDREFTRLTNHYLEDVTYTYGADGTLAGVHTRITELSFSNGALISTKETVTDEAYSGTVLVSRTTVVTVNGTETFRETMLYNERGDLTFHERHSNEGSYLETRSYYSDGKLMSLDIVSDRPGQRWGGERNPWDPPIIIVTYAGGKGSPDHYELHETYRTDGQISHREEVTRNTYYDYYYSWPIAYDLNAVPVDKANVSCIWLPRSYSVESRTVEDWEYAASGTLTHYKKEYTMSYDNPFMKGTGTYTETTERFYDAVTGKIMSERYTTSGYQFARPWRVKAEIMTGSKSSGIPDDVNEFLGGVMDSFYASSGATQEMNIIYRYDAAGKLIGVEIAWTQTTGDTQVYAFTCKIDVKDGKIGELVIRETGDRAGPKDIIINKPRRDFIDSPVVFTQKGVDCGALDRLAVTETQANQRDLPEGVDMGEFITTFADKYGCKVTRL